MKYSHKCSKPCSYHKRPWVNAVNFDPDVLCKNKLMKLKEPCINAETSSCINFNIIAFITPLKKWRKGLTRWATVGDAKSRMLISIKYLSLLITRENVNTMLISLNRLLPLSKSANCMRLFQYWEGWIIFQLHKAGGNCNGIVLSAGGNCNVNVHLLYPYCGLRIIKATTSRKRHLQIS